MAIRRVVAPAPQPCTASRLKSATHDINLLRSESRCRRYVSDLSNVTPRYLGSEEKGRVMLLWLTVSSPLASLLRWKTADTDFVVQSFSFQVSMYSPKVAMSLLSTPSTTCQSPSTCTIAKVVSICTLSREVVWQIRDVYIEEKGCKDGSLSDAVLEAL